MSCVCVYSRISEEKIMLLKFFSNISKGDGEGVGIEMERSTSRYFWELLKYRFQEIEGLVKISRNSKFTRLTFPFHTLSQKKLFRNHHKVFPPKVWLSELWHPRPKVVRALGCLRLFPMNRLVFIG